MLIEIIALLLFLAGLAVSMYCEGKGHRPVLGCVIQIAVCITYLLYWFTISKIVSLLLFALWMPLLRNTVAMLHAEHSSDEEESEVDE